MRNDVRRADMCDQLVKYGIIICAIGMTVFHMAASLLFIINPMVMRSLHIGFALCLIFLYAVQEEERRPLRWIYLGFMAVSAVVSLYIITEAGKMAERTPWLKLSDYVIGAALVFIILVAAYKATGIWLPLITSLVLGYTLIGPSLKGMFHYGGISAARFFSSLYFGTNGIFGDCVGLSAKYIFLFIIYSQLLIAFGIDHYFVRLSVRIFGRNSGGARVAVLAGFLTGLAGSRARINVVSTGSLTIPEMSKNMPAEEAGGLVVAASVGGKLTPPLLGAAAFYMMDRMGISFGRLCLMVLIPAGLFYIALFLKAMRMERKYENHSLMFSDIDTMHLFRDGWGYLASIASLVIMYVYGHTRLDKCVFIGVVVLLLSELINTFIIERHIDFKRFAAQIVHAVEDGCEAAVPVAVSTACLGIIFGVLYAIGMNLRLSKLLFEVYHGNVAGLLAMTVLLAVLLGAQVPSIAAYIALSNLLIPVLLYANVPVAVAYVFLLYYVNLAAGIPPFGAVAAIGAKIARADRKAVGRAAFLALLPGLILPLLIVIFPAMLLFAP